MFRKKTLTTLSLLFSVAMLSFLPSRLNSQEMLMPSGDLHEIYSISSCIGFGECDFDPEISPSLYKAIIFLKSALSDKEMILEKIKSEIEQEEKAIEEFKIAMQEVSDMKTKMAIWSAKSYLSCVKNWNRTKASTIEYQISIFEKIINCFEIETPIAKSYNITQLSSDCRSRGKSSINLHGEIVWEEIVDGNWQIMSNKRGQITSGAKTHESPSINNQGEIIWNEKIDGYMQVFSNERGQITSGSPHHMEPEINSKGEIIWSEGGQIFSNERGQLTFGGRSKGGASLNSLGEIVWTERVDGDDQVFSNIRGQLTFGDIWHWRPDINDRGEITWHEYRKGDWKAQVAVLGYGRITSEAYNHYNPSINDNGEIIFDKGCGGGHYLMKAVPEY